MIFLQLFAQFFKISLFAVGGGMATVPFLYDLSDTTGWFTHAQLIDMLAISESTPGPIGVNMATYVGYTTAGIGGAAAATLGIVTPCVILILLIARVLQQFRSNRYVDAVFRGLRPASTALIAAAGIGVAKVALLNHAQFAATSLISDLFRWDALLLALSIFILSRWVPKIRTLHPLAFILLSAIVGILFRFGGV